MSAPRTLDTIEHRWQRRLICFAILPIVLSVTFVMMVAASYGVVANAARFLLDYWRK